MVGERTRAKKNNIEEKKAKFVDTVKAQLRCWGGLVSLFFSLVLVSVVVLCLCFLVVSFNLRLGVGVEG